jgi:1,4-alpha-glucan branching enzyme
MERSALVLVLHAHLPWVRHPELPFFMEEHWLFEAIAETYLPLIEGLRRLADEGVPARLTMDVSPPLASMLCDDLLRDRAEEYFERLIELLAKEKERTHADAGIGPVVNFYDDRLRRLLALYRSIDRDVCGEFARLEDRGVLELATCAGTHPLLPMLMDRPEMVRGHVRTAVREHTRIFGRRPRGIWLPECAYAPGVDRYLAEADIRWFIVDAHGVEHARPRPRYGVHAPVYTEYGVAAFARDIEPARQVWSSEAGYPGDPLYREFYRDVGWDLPYDYVRPYIDPDGARMFTGLKYYRITRSGSDHREPYDPGAAYRRADDHAGHFFDSRVADAHRLATHYRRPVVITSPYDAELFGHWWFEGPWFLEMLLKKIAYDARHLDALSPSQVLAAQPENQVVQIEACTWGAGGYFDVWLGRSNEWCMPHLIGIGERCVRLLREYAGESEAGDRLLRQTIREAMLAQSSDWTFLMSTGTAVEYASRRFREHIQRFNRLCRMSLDGQVDETFLALCEDRDRLFPDLRLEDFV